MIRLTFFERVEESNLLRNMKNTTQKVLIFDFRLFFTLNKAVLGLLGEDMGPKPPNFLRSRLRRSREIF